MIVPHPRELSTTVNGSPAQTNLNCADTTGSCARIPEWRKKVSLSWSSLHISYRGGQYSIERLLALEEYMRNTSLMRAVLVCVATPLPALLLMLLQESVPLQDPFAGWAVNYTYWFRVFILVAVVANNIFVHAEYLVQGCIISTRQHIALVLCASVLETALAIAVAVCTWFPVPFAICTMTPPFYPMLAALFYNIVGLPIIREMRKHSDEVCQYLKFVSAQQLMGIIYPAYQILFYAASNTNYELPMFLVLPIMKLIVKNIFRRCVADKEDIMPEAVIFTVDFFNALYLATSVENTSSNSTVVMIILVDIAQISTVLFRLHRRTDAVLARMNEVIDLSERDTCLISAARRLCEQADKFRRQDRLHVRIYSCFSHRLSPTSQNLLAGLEKIPRRWHHAPPNRTAVARPKKNKVSTFASPTETSISPAFSCIAAQGERTARGINLDKEILRETLEALFTSECLTLGAYLDTVIPFVYAIFLFVLAHLPSAKYHTELVNVTCEDIGKKVNPVLIISWVEFVALGLLAALVYRNLGMRTVYHLAFVLETQKKQIQSKLLGWVLVTMAFRVVHFGIDFTFKFAWIKNSTQ